ncbi:CPBP family intramembrane metalloprotease domain-containing protein [Arthrobacter psychrolactophilus]|uniref:CPBP family intramembrane metalloprotease domain-containing protein n=1 Tax=Arthrobacter psychrolactophilus TaxID=92442 RepID=A0A2V5ISG6_9MICC|nr:CPBP family intramembrane glutamic endopeptidase [Arthrobacter psychrolactophilus]PYI38322.1 CPBP family intramembrane metalloprotease domain-containing protein [Arthrobacter psychrolactophilus]
MTEPVPALTPSVPGAPIPVATTLGTGAPPAQGAGFDVDHQGWGSKSRQRLIFEVLLVLGVSLGKSAAFSIMSLLESMSRAPLAEGTAQLNVVRNNREFFDLSYQLMDIFFALVPVMLVLYLLAEPGKSVFRTIGLDLRHPVRDGLGALGLLVIIGVPSLGLYAAGRALGVTLEIVPSSLNQYWWTIPVLVLSAIRAGVLEEVVLNGYLIGRLQKIGLGPWVAIVLSAVLRGAYHAYQGFGPFLGNFAMGLLFGWVYKKYGRVAPLVVAHALIDIAAFTLGPALGFGG